MRRTALYLRWLISYLFKNSITNINKRFPTIARGMKLPPFDGKLFGLCADEISGLKLH